MEARQWDYGRLFAALPSPHLVVTPDLVVVDMLLGVDPGTRRDEHVVTLQRDSTVLRYTDGLIERRDATIDGGIDRLVSVVQELAGSDLDTVCDGVLARMVRGRPDDDVALVAVRLHRQDRPRPPVAGPTVVPARRPRTAEAALARAGSGERDVPRPPDAVVSRSYAERCSVLDVVIAAELVLVPLVVGT